MMNRFITISAVISLCFLNIIHLEAQTAVPNQIEKPSASGAEAKSLDLTYAYGGDFILGTVLSEEEIAEKIVSVPNIEELDLSGQVVSSSLMVIIHDLTRLKKLSIKGSVCFNNGDGLYYSSESVNQQEVSEEMLFALIQNGSQIEILDFSLTTINDKGLEQIAQGAFNLRELYLIGTSDITEAGILSMVEKLPNLKLIDLSGFILRKPAGTQESITPEVSEELIKKLKGRGLIVIQNDRTPWF